MFSGEIWKILILLNNFVSYAAIFSGVTQRSPHKRLLKTEPHSFPDL